ncbi:hypothetical protein BN6_28860 [Saccharothrix espanaensis DSM 44229]|uniref:Transposase n=1 Tax=Saccharothrix espanaensis (strain ATCC 51144 / DSM 44229 / JCM 9112 / NBRC 15066 / NRRL 15764) TaxID=1179773 RepID=K0JRF5_SACES|nr:hypothetical protein BN6_28860 [Saccharothrix espanaensis DSM 44229]
MGSAGTVDPDAPGHFRYPSRRRVDDRVALEGVLYAVRTGIGWNRLPTALFRRLGRDLLAAVDRVA